MGNPLVSVIIATYNGKEKRFTQTIESVLNQSYKNIELIIVNDASTNNIENTILKYCKNYDNIIYLKNEKNSERSYSRNRGIFESKGKYIAFLDDDDIWNDKGKIKKQVNFLENNEDYVLCGTSMIEIDEEDKELKRIVVINGNNKIKSVLLQRNQFVFSSVLLKKSVLLYAGMFNSEKNLGEDYDLWLRIGKYGKIDNISDSFVQYRTWQGNTSTLSGFRIKKESFKLCLKYGKYYPNFFKALIYRLLFDFLLPKNVTKFLVKIKKNIRNIFNIK